MIGVLRLLWRAVREIGLRPTWDAARYHLRKLWYQHRFGRYELPGQDARETYVRPGPVVAHRMEAQVLRIDCTAGTVVLTVLAPDVIRVRYLPGAGGSSAGEKAAPHPPGSYVLARADDAWPPCDVEVNETDSAVELTTIRLTCRIDKESARLAFLDRDGAVINKDAVGAGRHPTGAVISEKSVQPDERFYGLGERTCGRGSTDGLNRRGRVLTMWNSDPQTYAIDQDPVYLCIPFLVGVHSGGRQGYGILFENTFRARLDLGSDHPDVASYTAVGGEMVYTFIYGPGLTRVMERYTTLTGRMPLPPLWTLGYHQSRWSYYPADRVRRLADDFRRVYDVPCDGIHLDIHYMEGYRCFTWDRERFPDPAGLIGDLHDDGFKVVTILDAGIKADPDYEAYRSGLEAGVFCTLPNGRPIKGPVWPGDSTFPDFTSPRARIWWQRQLNNLLDVGVDGIWNDMNEPAVFGLEGTTLPDATRHDLDGKGGDHAEAHNVYGLQMARATDEGLRAYRPEHRPFSFTRSGWAGIQRHAYGWTGDNAATWEQMWLTMPMVMNLGLSGLAFTGADIGGFNGAPSAELFTRWLQMSVFLPFFRSHTHLNDPDQEPWSWGEPHLSINRSWIEHRYRLLPYLYTAFWQCAQSGLPIARPLLMAFQADTTAHRIDDQFMCGDDLLVAPIFTPGGSRRTVYLPEDSWYDVWTDRVVSGPAQIVSQAPIERIPIYVRAGAVIPLAPPMAFVGERPIEELTLHVYPPTWRNGPGQDPSAEGTVRESVLYEDDGETFAFQGGDHRLTHFRMEARERPLRELRLKRQVQGAYGGACDSFAVVVHGLTDRPASVTCDGHKIGPEHITFTPSRLSLTAGSFHRVTVRWS
jgi:alpha-glucosidase